MDVIQGLREHNKQILEIKGELLAHRLALLSLLTALPVKQQALFLETFTGDTRLMHTALLNSPMMDDLVRDAFDAEVRKIETFGIDSQKRER